MSMPAQPHPPSPEEVEATLQQLEQKAVMILTARGGFGWLLNGPQFYGTQDIVRGVSEAGLKAANATIDRQVVIRWVNQIEATRPEYVQDFGGSFGKRVSRRGLLYWFAGILDDAPALS